MSSPELPLELFGADLLITDAAELVTYEIDAGFDRSPPGAVLLPRDVGDIRRLVEWAAQRGVSIVARGAGTGLAGGALARPSGIVVSLERFCGMTIDPEARLARVEAGVANEQVDAAASRHGLSYPPDPASGRTSVIGGNVGTNAGGPHCFKYGVTSHYVRGLEVVLADGRTVTLGGVADTPGYDLRALVVGSEGTLAIVTRVTLELRRRPPGVRTLMISFATLAGAGEAVSELIAAGLAPAAIEAIDRRGMEVIEAYRSVGLPLEAGAVLIVEVDGYSGSLERQVREVSDLLVASGGSDLRVARTEEERQEIWFARKSAAGALARLAPRYYLTDITVRRSRLAVVLERIVGICDRHHLDSASFFHAGDGNLHPLIPCDQNDTEMMERVETAVEEIIDLCLAEGGSITGEHGVGLEKRRFMSRMYGAAELSAMWDVKHAFDPKGLLNPGKVLPEAIGEIDTASPRSIEASVVEPVDAGAAAAALAWLAERSRRVRIGTGTGEGRRDDGAVLLSTRHMRGILELAAADLYVSVAAGTPLEDLERELRARGLASRLVAPWAGATVGGLLARNLNSPSRMLHGSLRDSVLAATIVLADGRILRVGRPLVKNVAGYDLQKVFVGSEGSLGLLAEVTLQIEPLPEERRTLEIRLGDSSVACAAARAAVAKALIAAGVVVLADGAASDEALWVRHTAQGRAEDVEAELVEVRGAWEGIGGRVEESGESATAAWAALTASADRALLVRVGVPPGSLPEQLATLLRRVAWRLVVDWPAGLIWCSVPVESAERAEEVMVELEGSTSEAGGYAVAVAAPEARMPRGHRRPEPAGVEIMRRLKERWDPAGILVGDWAP